MELVRTRLRAPAELSDVLTRPRLLTRLEDVATARVTLLQAPAGYGKTTLMSQWYRALRASRCGVSWLSVDGADDAAGLPTYLAAALAPVVRGDGVINLATLINALQLRVHRLYLFIDDVHMLAPEPLAALCQFIDRSPSAIHFILASRAIPEMPLARMRARGQLLELGVDELKFTAAEARQFIANADAPGLNESQLAKLLERTEGWITAIRLARLMLANGAGPDAMLASLTGSRCTVADFFAEEVLAELPQEVCDFLSANLGARSSMSGAVRCGHRRRLRPARCSISSASRAFFSCRSTMNAAGIDTTRYSPNFCGAGRLMNAPARIAGLQLRASRWFWVNGSPVEAIEHALRGGDAEHAAELLELQCLDMTYTGRLQLVCQFAARIPEAVLQPLSSSFAERRMDAHAQSAAGRSP